RTPIKPWTRTRPVRVEEAEDCSRTSLEEKTQDRARSRTGPNRDRSRTGPNRDRVSARGGPALVQGQANPCPALDSVFPLF
ncbi:hypothetical protein Ancab_014352, partial [Ancistrocladus abbreviatus]